MKSFIFNYTPRGNDGRFKQKLNKALMIGAAFLSLSIAHANASSASAAAPKGDAARGEALYNQGLPEKNVPACMSCHGANGHSAGGANPRLAGQHEAYIVKQLHEFKDPKKRGNPIMTPYSQALNDQQILDIAVFLAKQTPKDNYKTKSSLANDLGKKIYRGGIAAKGVPACAACHGPTGAGMPNQYPRLAGQSSEYTKGQLKAFIKDRKNNESMHQIAMRMNDEEMQAVADYTSALTKAK
jgi:cytochrome c553